MNRDHHALELDKILELLAGETSCEDAAAAARELEPSPSLSAALRQMEDTVAAYLLTARVYYRIVRWTAEVRPC